MATMTLVVLSCDLTCQREQDEIEKAGGTIETHQVSVDGRTVELDACSDCWPAATLDSLVTAGRKIKRA